MKKEPLHLLFDADMLAFESASSVEVPLQWEQDLWTLHADAALAKAQMEDRIAFIIDQILDTLHYVGEYKTLLCFSDDKENFRKSILSTYKANRAGKRKPICYKTLKDWARENYDTVELPRLEADDCAGILATSLPNTVHISGDKDFRSIPGRFYNFLQNELTVINEREADYWFYTQCLIGDTADNYTGCPGIGVKTAEKIFAKEGCSWGTVLKTYKRKGLTEEDALTQARVARILRTGEYDKKTKEVKLWTPQKS